METLLTLAIAGGVLVAVILAANIPPVVAGQIIGLFLVAALILVGFFSPKRKRPQR